MADKERYKVNHEEDLSLQVQTNNLVHRQTVFSHLDKMKTIGRKGRLVHSQYGDCAQDIDQLSQMLKNVKQS